MKKRNAILLPLALTVAMIVIANVDTHGLQTRRQRGLGSSSPITNPPPEHTIEADCWHLHTNCTIKEFPDYVLTEKLHQIKMIKNKAILSDDDLKKLNLPPVLDRNTIAFATRVTRISDSSGSFILYRCNDDIWIRHESLGGGRPMEHVVLIIYVDMMPSNIYFDAISAI